MIPPIVEKLKSFVEKHHPHGVKMICDRTGLGHIFITNILANKKGRKYMILKMKILYEYFNLPHDTFYSNNIRKWHQDHESILGGIFREKRLQLKKTIHDVAREIKTEDRTIKRIECGETLPNFDSYTVKKLINLYGFDDQELHTIGWYITITHDILSIYKKYVSVCMDGVDDLGKK